MRRACTKMARSAAESSDRRPLYPLLPAPAIRPFPSRPVRPLRTRPAVSFAEEGEGQIFRDRRDRDHISAEVNGRIDRVDERTDDRGMEEQLARVPSTNGRIDEPSVITYRDRLRSRERGIREGPGDSQARTSRAPLASP